MSDLTRLRATLAPVEQAARGLPWAKQRPWRAATHVWVEGRLPVVDLHDLGQQQARDAVRRAASLADDLDAGAIAVVTGRGRRSIGPGVLRQVAEKELARCCAETGGYYRPAGPGRLLFVVDPDRAPASATGRLGWGFRLGLLAFLVALAWALWRTFA